MTPTSSQQVPPKDYGNGDDEGMDDMGFNPKSSVVDQMEIRDQVGSMVFDDANTEQVQPPVKGKKR
jgi:hypothetical protein